MQNIETRNRILIRLYNFNEEHPRQYMSKEDLAQELDLTEERVTEEVLTLEAQGLVDKIHHSAAFVESARITPAGRPVADRLL